MLFLSMDTVKGKIQQIQLFSLKRFLFMEAEFLDFEIHFPHFYSGLLQKLYIRQ